MDRSLPDGYFTEGEGRKVVCAPDDGLILPPLAPSDVGQVLGRGGPGQFQGDGFSGATHGGQLSRAVIEIKPFDDFFLPFQVLIKDQLDFVFPPADDEEMLRIFGGVIEVFGSTP